MAYWRPSPVSSCCFQRKCKRKEMDWGRKTLVSKTERRFGGLRHCQSVCIAKDASKLGSPRLGKHVLERKIACSGTIHKRWKLPWRKAASQRKHQDGGSVRILNLRQKFLPKSSREIKLGGMQENYKICPLQGQQGELFHTWWSVFFFCKMEEIGRRRVLPAKSKKVGGHVENSRNEVRVWIGFIGIVMMTMIKGPTNTNGGN